MKFTLAMALLLASASRLQAELKTYSFTGSVSVSPNIINLFAPLPPGSPVSGSFVLDTSAAGILTTSPTQDRVFYQNSVTGFQLTVGSLTLSTSLAGDTELGIGHFLPYSDFYRFSSQFDTLSSGWTYIPSTITSFPQSISVELGFGYPPGTITDLAHLPAPVLNPFSTALFLGTGQYLYPGGSIEFGNSLGEPLELLLSITLVPEPSTFLLFALGLGGLMAMWWRRRSFSR